MLGTDPFGQHGRQQVSCEHYSDIHAQHEAQCNVPDAQLPGQNREPRSAIHKRYARDLLTVGVLMIWLFENHQKPSCFPLANRLLKIYR